MTGYRRAAGMLDHALSLIREADALHQRVFRRSTGAIPAWEPPADIVESPAGLLLDVALPGIPAERIDVRIVEDLLLIRAHRAMPGGAPGQVIRQLELPYGHFERRQRLPPGRFALRSSVATDGVLRITLQRVG